MENKYSLSINSAKRIVEVRLTSTVNLNLIEEILKELKQYIAEDYQIRLVGYIRKCNYLRAFTLALSLFGHDDRIVFENKARYSKAERKEYRKVVMDLRRRGYSVKEISECLSIPLKTIYRWLASQT
ncbi:MAG: helix-turn-helix domain-containing protein [Candidatus Bathyarchaeia archaeon]